MCKVSLQSRGTDNRNSGGAEGGFTLLEVLVALVILAVGMLGMASLTVSIISANQYSRDLTTGTTLAQQKMEELQSLGYAGISGVDVTQTENYNSIAGSPDFKRVTTIDVDAPAGTTMKTLTVTVFWDGDAKSVNLDTILAR